MSLFLLLGVRVSSLFTELEIIELAMTESNPELARSSLTISEPNTFCETVLLSMTLELKTVNSTALAGVASLM